MLRTWSSSLGGSGNYYTSMWHCPDCFALLKMTCQYADRIGREENLEKTNQFMEAIYFNSGSVMNLSDFILKKIFFGVANLNNKYNRIIKMISFTPRQKCLLSLVPRAFHSEVFLTCL